MLSKMLMFSAVYELYNVYVGIYINISMGKETFFVRYESEKKVKELQE